MRAIFLFALVACGGSATDSVVPAADVAAAATASAPGRDDAKWKYFGEPFTVAESVAASAVFADPSAHADKTVRMTGELTQVCQKMGCWAVVRDENGNTARITMKEHSFGIDKDAAGKPCDVEGTLVELVVDQKQLDHFTEEGATDHPEAGKDKAWQLVASSVAIGR